MQAHHVGHTSSWSRWKSHVHASLFLSSPVMVVQCNSTNFLLALLISSISPRLKSQYPPSSPAQSAAYTLSYRYPTTPSTAVSVLLTNNPATTAATAATRKMSTVATMSGSLALAAWCR
ncbi:hypothetical protein Micbo1qcDRAFT_155488 [Microdochium bolleyi]|uniref:Uncharacterized protein n=1 Tax=Microdochium bolleyi TaxID=196109 RepID=A0A136JI46_9PEZI|nr:hypothetical protein Micbo1qcDRAFT_155488 [Microdochium bolleyi]